MAYNKAEKTDSSMKRRAPRRRKKVCVFCGENNGVIDYKNVAMLKKYVSASPQTLCSSAFRNLCKASESNHRSCKESSSYRTYAIYSRVIGYKNKKSGVRTRLLKGAHESALLFSCWIVFIFGITAITM